MQNKVALITGAARRIGAEISQALHARGFNIVLHYRSSATHAEKLCAKLNQQRENSAVIVQADLLDIASLEPLASQAFEQWQRLDLLVNNASTFYPTPVGTMTEKHWDDLLGSNLKAPLFLSQAVVPFLQKTLGNIINIVDVHAERPMKSHTMYCTAKAGLAMLTKSLAKELGPEIRVNGVAPGAILWPENEMNEETQTLILERTALKRSGEPQDIANAVAFLAIDASYITGHILPVDGGRSLNI